MARNKKTKNSLENKSNRRRSSSDFLSQIKLGESYTSLFLGIVVLITQSKTKHTLKNTAITGVLRFFQSLSWVILIFVVGNLSLVSAVTTFKVVVIFVSAAIFLKEREDLPRKILGSFIAIAGILIMG